MVSFRRLKNGERIKRNAPSRGFLLSYFLSLLTGLRQADRDCLFAAFYFAAATAFATSRLAALVAMHLAFYAARGSSRIFSSALGHSLLLLVLALQTSRYRGLQQDRKTSTLGEPHAWRVVDGNKLMARELIFPKKNALMGQHFHRDADRRLPLHPTQQPHQLPVRRLK